MVIIWVPAVLILSKFSIKTPTAVNLFIIFLAAVSYMLIFYALSRGKLALTGTVVSLYPMTTVILSSVFLKEQISAGQFLGIGSILLGGVLLALPERKKQAFHDLSWFWWGAATAISIGTGDFLTKLSTNMIGAHSHLFFIAIIFQFLSVANYLIDQKGRQLPKFSQENFLPTLLGLFILWGGSLLFFLSFDFGPASLITPVSSIYPALMVILAVIFLKEKITPRQGLGVAAAVLGTVLIGVGM